MFQLIFFKEETKYRREWFSQVKWKGNTRLIQTRGTFEEKTN